MVDTGSVPRPASCGHQFASGSQRCTWFVAELKLSKSEKKCKKPQPLWLPVTFSHCLSSPCVCVLPFPTSLFSFYLGFLRTVVCQSLNFSPPTVTSGHISFCPNRWGPTGSPNTQRNRAIKKGFPTPLEWPPTQDSENHFLDPGIIAGEWKRGKKGAIGSEMREVGEFVGTDIAAGEEIKGSGKSWCNWAPFVLS